MTGDDRRTGSAPPQPRASPTNPPTKSAGSRTGSAEFDGGNEEPCLRAEIDA